MPEEPNQAVSARARAATEAGVTAGGDPRGTGALDGPLHQGAAGVRRALRSPCVHLQQRHQESLAQRAAHEEAGEAGQDERAEEEAEPGPPGEAGQTSEAQARQDSRAPHHEAQRAGPELKPPPGYHLPYLLLC